MDGWMVSKSFLHKSAMLDILNWFVEKQKNLSLKSWSLENFPVNLSNLKHGNVIINVQIESLIDIDSLNLAGSDY